ncbi:MAG: DNA-processing protein DprA [Oscillospiraceae bacterium]
MDIYNIWLAMVVGTKCKNGGEIADCGFTPQELYERRKGWGDYPFMLPKQMERALTVTLDEAKAVANKHYRYGIESLAYCDDSYPLYFKNMLDAPVILFYKGDISLLKAPNIIGIVGSRNPDRDGRKICASIASALARNGVVIASGLAQGLDGEAHKAALKENGKTIAFIGTSLDIAYPVAHGELQNTIINRGCVLSEYHVGKPTPPTTFLERNRLIAASSKGVCVIQAKRKSGSLATAKNTLEYGKKLFAVPGDGANEMYGGTNKLVHEGATPLVSAKDVLTFLGLCREDFDRTVIVPKLKLTEDEQAIYDSLGNSTKSVIQLFDETHIPMRLLKSTLTKLELSQIIEAQSSGVYFIRN